ncbi:MAG TPA: folylpolyglutamate synthase/dihydrofolate synthase family protein [Lachnospiraceae bacterium]|nr:folylpolyglutamate synthase/dihydrofolate synthase family protein [Lachnospiraceae bacterium]
MLNQEKGASMNEKQAMEYIEKTNQIGSILGLESIRELLIRLGNPQDELKFVHIAGTNGKGSTLAYISTILRVSGYKVGRYISPTIVSYYERIQINERPIAKTKFASYLEKISLIINDMVEDGLSHPTSFEIETALGFLYFRDKKCDIVVLETGMGGALDATNIIKNTIATVFASISMDHMQFLGNTLEEIAKNKVGIIKDGCYVITTSQEKSVMKCLQDESKIHGCTFLLSDYLSLKKVKSKINKQTFTYEGFKELEISLNGRHQIENATLAISCIKALNLYGFKISEESIRKGLKETVWNGRFSVIGEKPIFIVDGAHNEDAAKRLAESIAFYFTNRKIIYIMGVLKDKEYVKIIEQTYSYAEQIITVTIPNNPRGMQAYDLAKEIKEFHNCVTVADSLQEAVEMSYLLADKNTVIVAFGSLSYLGELIGIVQERDKIRRDTHGK